MLQCFCIIDAPVFAVIFARGLLLLGPSDHAIAHLFITWVFNKLRSKYTLLRFADNEPLEHCVNESEEDTFCPCARSIETRSSQKKKKFLFATWAVWGAVWDFSVGDYTKFIFLAWFRINFILCGFCMGSSKHVKNVLQNILLSIHRLVSTKNIAFLREASGPIKSQCLIGPDASCKKAMFFVAIACWMSPTFCGHFCPAPCTLRSSTNSLVAALFFQCWILVNPQPGFVYPTAVLLSSSLMLLVSHSDVAGNCLTSMPADVSCVQRIRCFIFWTQDAEIQRPSMCILVLMFQTSLFLCCLKTAVLFRW